MDTGESGCRRAVSRGSCYCSRRSDDRVYAIWVWLGSRRAASALGVASITVVMVSLPVDTDMVFIMCGVRCSLRVGARGRRGTQVSSAAVVLHLPDHITPRRATHLLRDFRRDMSIPSHERWGHLRARRPKVFALGSRTSKRYRRVLSNTAVGKSRAGRSSTLHKGPARARPFLGWEAAASRSYGSSRGDSYPSGCIDTSMSPIHLVCVCACLDLVNDRKGSAPVNPKCSTGRGGIRNLGSRSSLTRSTTTGG